MLTRNNEIRPSYELTRALAGDYGDSFYLFSKKLFVDNLRNFRESFERHYSNVVLGYSFKTNYIPEICRIARAQGVMAEVVSGLEYELALRTGYRGGEIIFNGPLKSESELLRAFDHGSYVHFDAYSEIEVMRRYLAANPDASVKCALRCNFDIGEDRISRFGFDAESGEAAAVYRELFETAGCIPVGIHCHFSTRHRSLDSYRRRAERIIGFAKEIFVGKRPEYIDVGGGFFGDMPEHVKRLFPFEVPDISEYGRVIGGLMREYFPHEDVRLVLEPGVAVVASTMCFICGVGSIKRIGNRQVITLTGGIHNVRPTGTASAVPFDVIASGRGEFVSNALIGGYTYMENDVIDPSWSGELSGDDYLLFDNMGAYNIVFKPPFIKEAPPVLMMEDTDGRPDFTLIRRRETINDIFATYDI